VKTALLEHESEREIPISSGEIGIFPEEIGIFLPEIHRSLEEIPIFFFDLYIFLGDLCIFSLPTTQPKGKPHENCRDMASRVRRETILRFALGSDEC